MSRFIILSFNISKSIIINFRLQCKRFFEISLIPRKMGLHFLIHNILSASSSGASFFAWRVTGDEPQGTMGRVQTAGCLLPAFLCAHIFLKRETSGYEAEILSWAWIVDVFWNIHDFWRYNIEYYALITVNDLLNATPPVRITPKYQELAKRSKIIQLVQFLAW